MTPGDETKLDVTVDFDHHSPDIAVDPFAAWAKLRDRCPVTWTNAYDGFWILTEHAGVSEAFRNDAAFRAGPPGIAIPPVGIGAQIPLETDAPMTQKYRRILQAQFSPRAAVESEPVIRRIANELMDEFIERGEADFINEFSTPTAGRFILRLLGFDEGRWAEFSNWVHTIVHGVTNDPEAALTAAVEVYGAILDKLEERRAAPADDIVTDLLAAEIDGAPLDEDVVVNYTLLLILGGLDTTSAMLGNTVARLHRHPELRQDLLDHPELITGAVEEMLRIDPPVQALARTLNYGVEVCGRPLKEGDRAMLSIAAANRDPKEFPNPDAFDARRIENRHLAFGVGLHRCLGSHYGRTTFHIMLETVLRRTPDFEVIGNPDDYRLGDTAFVWGHHRLPVRFTPGQRVCT